MKRFKRLPGELNIHRIPRGGPPPDVECPLQGGDYVSFESCFDCEYYNDDFGNRSSHCRIEEEEEKERMARNQEELDREVAERDAKWEEEDRKMRAEMADLRDEMERDSKKWEKEYKKQEKEYKKLEEERKAMERESFVKLYGEREVEWVEKVMEKMKNDWNYDDEREDKEEEDNGEDW
jgi:hypothetical protein